MTFQQKRALVSLIAVGVAAVAYTARALTFPPQTPREAVPMLIGGAIGLTAMMIVIHIVLTIGAGSDEASRPAGETERRARGGARKASAGVLAFGLVIVGGLALVSAPPVILLQTAAGVVVLAQMVRYGSELAFAGRPA